MQYVLPLMFIEMIHALFVNVKVALLVVVVIIDDTTDVHTC